MVVSSTGLLVDPLVSQDFWRAGLDRSALRSREARGRAYSCEHTRKHKGLQSQALVPARNGRPPPAYKYAYQLLGTDK